MIWRMVPKIWNATGFLSLWTIFVILDPTNNTKTLQKKFKKKTSRDIIISYKFPKNHDHMLSCSWDMPCDRCNCKFSFSFSPFNPLPPLTAQKNILRTHVYQKLWSDDVRFLKYDARQTDGRTDGRTKRRAEVGDPPKKHL